MWLRDWDRRHGYTLLTLSFNDEVRGSIIIKDKTEEHAWNKAIDQLMLNQSQVEPSNKE